MDLAIIAALGVGPVVLIVVLALLLFGGKKIPELMKGLGTGMREFKKATSEDDEVDNKKDQGKISQE